MDFEQKKHGGLIAFLIVISILLIIGLYCFFSVKTQMNRLESVQEHLQTMILEMERQDLNATEKEYYSITKTLGKIRSSLNGPFWRCAGLFPALSTELDSARTALDLYAQADSTIGTPLFSLLKNYPVDCIRDDDGIRYEIFQHYSAFLRDAVPSASQITAKARTLDLGKLDANGRIKTYILGADDLMKALNDISWTELDNLVIQLQEQAQSGSFFNLSLTKNLISFTTDTIPKLNNAYQVLRNGPLYPAFASTQFGHQVDSTVSIIQGGIDVLEILALIIGSRFTRSVS